MNSVMSFVGTFPEKRFLKQSTHFVAGEFDKTRMEKALASEVIELPEGLTREEQRKFIIESSR